VKNNRIGIIAGGGQFPYLFAQSARRQGKEIVIIALIFLPNRPAVREKKSS